MTTLYMYNITTLYISAVAVEGKEKLINKDDTHVVFIRPKTFVDSSGTTWANETEELRTVLPDKFEVQPADGHNYSPCFRGVCARIRDDSQLFVEMTMKEDLKRVSTENNGDPHFQYEKERLAHFIVRLESSMAMCGDNSELRDGEANILATRIVPKLTGLIDQANALQDDMPSGQDERQDAYEVVLEKCHSVVDTIDELKLPPVKPRWADFCDAGPGVGSNNFEVQFRDAELAIIHNSDYRIRLHSSRGNSADNEAERTNSAIGDSVVDGSTLEWNHYKRFDGMTDDEIAKLTVKEFDEREMQRMEKNAWHCAEEIRRRVDGAPVFSEFIKSYLTPKESCFFFNKKYLKQYQGCSSLI